MNVFDIIVYILANWLSIVKWNFLVPVRADDGAKATPPASSGGDTGTKTGVELSLKKTSGTNEFDYKKSGNIVTYTAKDNYAFKSVKTGKNGDVLVWSTDQTSEYATKVVLDGKGKKEKKVTIHLPNNTTKVYKRDGKGKQWIEVAQQSNQTSGGTPSSGANGSGTITGIGLSIDSQDGTGKFHCKKNGQRRTYTPKGNNAFNLVGEFIDRKPVIVWKSSGDSEYSSKVEVDLMNGQPKVVTVYLKDNTKLFEKKSDNKTWETIDTEKVNPRSLNIKYEHSSYFCNNELKGTVRTFTAKKGFAFKLVYEFIDQKNRPEIWKTDQVSEYANKVVFEGVNNVTIYIGNDGSTKVYKKGTDNKWTEDAALSKKGSSTDGSGGGSIPESKPATQ